MSDYIEFGLELHTEDTEHTDDLSEYSEIDGISLDLGESMLEVLCATNSYEEHEQVCRELEDQEKNANGGKHPYLNSPASEIRKSIEAAKFFRQQNSVSGVEVRMVKNRVAEQINDINKTVNDFSLIHSKLYLLISAELYNRYGIVSDDIYSEKLITALFDNDNKALEELQKDNMFSKYHEVFREFTENIQVGMDYSTPEKLRLREKYNIIVKKLDKDLEPGNLLKTIYVLDERINSLNGTLDYFEFSNIFYNFNKNWLTQEEAFFVVNTLFDKPRANKFAFLDNIEVFDDLLENTLQNRTMLQRAIRGLANSFRFKNNEALSFQEGYNNFMEYFSHNIPLITGNLEEDEANAWAGELLKEMNTFIKSTECLSSFAEWNKVSCCSFVLRHMRAQQMLPDYYDSTDTLENVYKNIFERLTDKQGPKLRHVQKCNLDLFVSEIFCGENRYPFVLEFAKPKKMLSAVEKILRASNSLDSTEDVTENKPKIDDTFRCRVGIPYETKMKGNMSLESYCYAATSLIMRKLGGSALNIRKVKASLLKNEEHLNKFSQNIKTFKYILDVIIEGKVVPIEIMMVLFYPDDHSTYKGKQCESSRNKVGLIPAEIEIEKAIEYLNWKYTFESEISDVDVVRLNSIVKTLLNEKSTFTLTDQTICDRLKDICSDFYEFLLPSDLASIMDMIEVQTNLNERVRFREEINYLYKKYIEGRKCKLEKADQRIWDSILDVVQSKPEYLQEMFETIDSFMMLAIKLNEIDEDTRDNLLDLVNKLVADMVSPSQ